MLRGKKKKEVGPEGQMELVEHLAELRSRLFRTLLYIVVGMVVTFRFFPELFELLQYPIRHLNVPFIVTNLPEGFLLRLQVSFLSGLALASPFVIMELWGFVAPALTPQERRPIFFLAPFSILLFLAGVGTAYASLPAAYGWMHSFVKGIPEAQLLQSAQQYILLTVKILLSGGVAFQLPVVLLFLARVGLITADIMTRYWRHAIILIATSAAVITPSADPLTMMIIGTPMAGLYALSIGLVRAIEPKPDGSRSLSFAAMLLAALAPVGILIAVGYYLWRSAG